MTETAHKRVIALGFFDGVHLGHARLIETAKRRALELGASPSVLSFDLSPMSVVTGERVPLICGVKERGEIIKNDFGVEDFIVYHFDETVMKMPWEDFISSLVTRFSAVSFVIGHDFSCGYKGRGTAEKISRYCKENGVGCDVIPAFLLDGVTVSSTYIRALIAAGDVETASRFLGRPYRVSGEVKEGRGVGRTLGTPTINLEPAPEAALPKNGVYATTVLVDGARYKAVTNIGLRPTFGENGALTLEGFLLDFSGDLYGQHVNVDFYSFLRPEKKFATPKELGEQIKKDAEEAGRRLTLSL